MARKARDASFDPNMFLATVNRDRTKLEYRSEGVISRREPPPTPSSTFCGARSKSS
jgi:hypothetical protein